MRAVTEWLGCGSAAATKRDPFFGGIKFPVSVFQFHWAVHEQGPVSNDFDGDFRHAVSCSGEYVKTTILFLKLNMQDVNITGKSVGARGD
jgi:hypothetical protein